jgi:hypothetical protein
MSQRRPTKKLGLLIVAGVPALVLWALVYAAGRLLG